MTYIYALQHNVTKKIYIGKSKNIYKRYKAHISSLRCGKHTSKSLQEDFNVYGEDFSIYVLEEIDNDAPDGRYEGIRTRVIDAELKWMKKYDTINSGYNDQDRIAKRMIASDNEVFPLKKGHPFLLKN